MNGAMRSASVAMTPGVTASLHSRQAVASKLHSRQSDDSIFACGQFPHVKNPSSLQYSRQSLASCRGKHLGKVTAAAKINWARMLLNKYKDLEPGHEEIDLVDQFLKAMQTGRPSI